MKTSIATVSISGTLTEKLEAVAAAGYDGIELFEHDFIAFDGSPRDFRNTVRDFGLEIFMLQPLRDFEGFAEPLRTKAFDRAERKFDLMCDLGTDLIGVCSSVHPEALGGLDRAAADFHELGERAAARGLRVGYEALSWGRYVNDHRDAWEIVKRADHDNVGLIVDSFHTLARKIDPNTIRDIPGEKIIFAQLADAPAFDMDLIYWSRHFRNMPGEGDLRVTEFMRAVMATNYSGPISLEIFNDQFRSGSTLQVARDGYRSLVALMDDVRRVEPSPTLDLPAFPPRQKVNDVAFLEFSGQGEEASELEALFETLGFELVGHHRTRAIRVFQQGSIRFLLNEEEGGPAGQTLSSRGMTVCGIGLNVTSVADTLARADALGIGTFSHSGTPSDLGIPAVSGPFGSVVYLGDEQRGIRQIWERDFVPTKAVSGANQTRVDHLAQTVSYDGMLSWVLFYNTLFETEKSPMIDVFDPHGLVRSQVITSPDGAFRVTLNGADSSRTLAGSFLAENIGSTVQHIALATDDIFATLSKLEKSGFKALRMPKNYYDDLAARFDFSPGLLDKMRAASVLYDRDAGGELFQCYSSTFSSGLFFEIVQRSAGYSGYGAPNAPFRIAAQKRLNGSSPAKR